MHRGYPTAGDARRGAGGGQDPADRSLANAVPEAAFPDAVDAVRGTFSLQKMIMVGDRGMNNGAPPQPDEACS